MRTTALLLYDDEVLCPQCDIRSSVIRSGRPGASQAWTAYDLKSSL